MGDILYQGHASFRIRTNSNLVIYIDPYAGAGYDLPADVILITHHHFDHEQTDMVPKKEDCTIIDRGVVSGGNIENAEYNIFDINDVTIEAVPAYNHFHPKDFGVGYIISVDGRKLYITGDTGNIEEAVLLKDKNIDIVFVPCDGTYTMNMEEAAGFSEKVNAMFSVPVHTAPQSDEGGMLYDKEVAEKINLKNKLIIKPGENIVL